MIYTPMTRKAMRIAYEAHDGQMDKSGLPYIFHPYTVAQSMEDEITTCVALLHDVMEDTDITDEELSQQFPEEVMRPLRLLTHDPSESYMDYIEKLAADPVAVAVKMADLAHNMDQSRVAGTNISPEQIAHWNEKYTAARQYLHKFAAKSTR